MQKIAHDGTPSISILVNYNAVLRSFLKTCGEAALVRHQPSRKPARFDATQSQSHVSGPCADSTGLVKWGERGHLPKRMSRTMMPHGYG